MTGSSTNKTIAMKISRGRWIRLPRFPVFEKQDYLRTHLMLPMWLLPVRKDLERILPALHLQRMEKELMR